MKWIFFDFNGTIINDVELCLELLNKILEHQGKNQVDVEKYRNIFGFPVKKYYEVAGIDFSKDSFEDLSKWFIKEYQPRSYACELFPHCRETILELKKRGFKVGVLSASEISNLKDQLTKFAIIDLFDAVLGLDNIHASSKIGVGIEFLEKNGISGQDVLFIGDTDHDFEVAKAMGSNILLFTNGHQSREVLAKTGAKLIDDYREIFSYVR